MKTRRLFVIPLVALCAMALIAADGEKKAKKRKKAARAPVHVAFGQLILVKDFSTDNTKAEGRPKKGATRVAKKKKRLPPVLAGKIHGRLVRHGYNAVPYSSDSSATGALVVDGEFVLIHPSQPRMTVRVWVYHTDAPSKRIVETEVSAVSTAGPVAMASVAMNNLAHNVIACLLRDLPPIIEEIE